ncbi:MAG: LuxR C-terminal-related transcriptional regulator [Candidatus Promineifilaceae bacterium]
MHEQSWTGSPSLSRTRYIRQVADSLVLRQFCRVYFEAVPDQSTLCRWANLIQPQTLQAFNQRIMNLAIDSKLTRGRQLRMDGTVVETTIHHPTDSRLLAESVRVLGRSLAQAIRAADSGQATISPKVVQAMVHAATQPPAPGHDLTKRERTVLGLMVEGLNNTEIAARLVVSPSTVKSHVSHILRKLDVASRTEAVALAVRHHLVD